MKPLSNSPPSRKGFITNYPPYRHWKAVEQVEVQGGRALSIYVHIPFCLQRCAYCYYRTNELKEKAKILDRYVDALCREIRLASQHFHLRDRRVVSIYFGGGTPTLLKGEQLERITASLYEHLNIANVEFTVEAEPVTLTESKAVVLKKLGVNRISLGVQSFRDEILALCNRLDDEEKVVQAIDIAQNIGAVVNVDLLSGLAGETDESWAYSVDRALASSAESITVYKMELYANTDYYQRLKKNKIILPDDAQEVRFMQHAMARFSEANYQPWCFFTFTRNGGYQHTYITSVWSGNDCYAFGASAFGELGNLLYQNSSDEEKYMASIEAGQLPMNRSYQLSALEQMIRRVMLGMKMVHFDLQAFRNEYGFALESLAAVPLRQLEKEGYITMTADAVCLTEKGILYGDYVGKCVAKPLQGMQG